jgi:hypothetical protein
MYMFNIQNCNFIMVKIKFLIVIAHKSVDKINIRLVIKIQSSLCMKGRGFEPNGGLLKKIFKLDDLIHFYLIKRNSKSNNCLSK